MRSRFTISLTSLLLVLALAGCGDRTSPAPARQRKDREAPNGGDTSARSMVHPRGKGSVYFQLREIEGTMDTSGMRSWLGIYYAGGKTARFQLDLKLPRHAKAGEFASAQGTLYRVKNSDPSVLLGDIATALQASVAPKPRRKIDSLPLPMVVLGTNLSRTNEADGGHLASEPAGDWIATKVFVADGDAEFFLNLNLIDGWGEISIKDPDYGNRVVAELAEVL